MRILIGVPMTRMYPPFLSSLKKLMFESEHELDLITTKDVFLPDAQEYMADVFLKNNYEGLLFLDDDHSGHTPEMLNILINSGALFSTMKTYSRHYPYSCTLLRRVGNKYAGIENGIGYQECDLTGFPMSLVRRELFSKLEKPYFPGRNDGGRDWTTDRSFCERIIALGIKPIGCFQHCLNHMHITQENVQKLREDERHENNNIAFYQLFQARKALEEFKTKESTCMAHQ